MRLSLRRLTSRWKLKLAALGLAILLWVVVSAEQDTTQWVSVRVEPVLRDPDFVLTGPAEPRTVRVKLGGRGRELWEAGLRRPVLVLPVRNGATRNYALDGQMVQLPENLSLRVLDLRPAIVHLELQRVAVRTVPVRPALGSRSAAEYLLGRDVSVSPSEVRVSGAEDAVAQIDTLFTAPIEVAPGDSADGISRRVALDTAGLGGVHLSAAEVRVRARVERRADRTFDALRIGVPDGFVTEPAAVRVQLTGTARQLAELDSSQVRVALVRDSVPLFPPDSGARVGVSVFGVPEGVRVRVTPQRVLFRRAPAPPPSPAPVPAPAPAARPR